MEFWLISIIALKTASMGGHVLTRAMWGYWIGCGRLSGLDTYQSIQACQQSISLTFRSQLIWELLVEMDLNTMSHIFG